MTSIAYVIIAFREPDWVARLVNRVQTASDLVWIHFDTMIGNRKFRDWKRFVEHKCSGKNVKIVSKFRCKRAAFGIVEVMLDAMDYYENHNYDYFLPLTGDSYPLKPPEVIKKHLEGLDVAFMEWKLPSDDWWKGGWNRINNRFYFMPHFRYPYAMPISIPRLRKGLPYGLEAYGGNGLFCLPKKHVGYILQFVKSHPDLTRFFRRVWGPEEILFHTILMNSPLRSSVVNESLLYVDFSEGKSHPKILTTDDLEKLKKSGKFFARKFDLLADKTVLDALDGEIEKIQNGIISDK